jgi:hypothetical protein
MPFIRLVAIYLAVFLVAALIYNREAVIAMFTPVPAMELPPIPAAPGPETVVKTTPEPTLVPVAESAPDPASAPTVEIASAPVVNAPAAPATTELETPVATDTPPAPTQTTAPATGDMQTRLDAARQAYWNGDISGAETLYLALVRDFANDPDIKGELGNLYYSQQRFGQAADYYRLAAELLLQAGNTQQVTSIIGVLQGIAPQKAADLRQLVAQRQ